MEYNWSTEYATQGYNEFLKFLVIKRVAKDWNNTICFPPPVIEKIWQLAILNTWGYSGLCGKNFIHHSFQNGPTDQTLSYYVTLNGCDPDPVFWRDLPPSTRNPLQPPMYVDSAAIVDPIKKKVSKKSSSLIVQPRKKRVSDFEVREIKKPKNYPRFDLYIQFQSQPQLHLAGVDASYSVGMVKDLIFQARKVKQSEQELVYMKDELLDEKLLEEYGIYSDSTVFLNVSMYPVQIFIKSLAGKTLDFQVLLTDTVQSLKEKIFKVEKIPVLQQRLFFGNTCLSHDSHSLVSFRVEPNSTLLLFLQDRDGSIDEILQFAENSGLSRKAVLPTIGYPQKRNAIACVDCNRRRKKCFLIEGKSACQNCFERKIKCVFPKNFKQSLIIESDSDLLPCTDKSKETKKNLLERDPFSFLFAAASESLQVGTSASINPSSHILDAMNTQKVVQQELNAPFKAGSESFSPDPLSMDADTEKTFSSIPHVDQVSPKSDGLV
jgi:hypothetical protein